MKPSKTPNPPKSAHKKSGSKLPLTKSSVRIIGGLHKRRLIEFVAVDGLRPTPDRLRETLFNWLMGDLQEANVLDVCAGSGVLSFEAISRGASHATLIEFNKNQVSELTKTTQTLKLNNINIIQGDCLKILPTLNTRFDVVFIDPPYSLNLWQDILNKLIDCQLINNNTLIYVEGDRELTQMINNNNIELLKNNKVGAIFAYLIQVKNF